MPVPAPPRPHASSHRRPVHLHLLAVHRPSCRHPRARSSSPVSAGVPVATPATFVAEATPLTAATPSAATESDEHQYIYSSIPTLRPEPAHLLWELPHPRVGRLDKLSPLQLRRQFPPRHPLRHLRSSRSQVPYPTMERPRLHQQRSYRQFLLRSTHLRARQVRKLRQTASRLFPFPRSRIPPRPSSL